MVTAVATLSIASVITTQSWWGDDTRAMARLRVGVYVGFAALLFSFSIVGAARGFKAAAYYQLAPWMHYVLLAAAVAYVVGPLVYSYRWPEAYLRPSRPAAAAVVDFFMKE